MMSEEFIATFEDKTTGNEEAKVHCNQTEEIDIPDTASHKRTTQKSKISEATRGTSVRYAFVGSFTSLMIIAMTEKYQNRVCFVFSTCLSASKATMHIFQQSCQVIFKLF
ncbi:hypothetical protein LIER_23738 [Lithospermum erythrorhizon]|uniref:Uncharacterized protein n=1 Tax=Lithospermum erythrorhizon TaxID=34254 RepID=A0AAV3R1A3_LITER